MEFLGGSMSCIGCMEVNGTEIVFECPCNSARKYEEFLMNEATNIARYLNKRAKAMRDKANQIEVKDDI